MDSAHGVAIFWCEPAGIFQMLTLARAVEPLVRLDERPFIQPLVELVSPGHWCVLLISSRASRILEGSRESLHEALDVRDDVHRRHKRGGLSQARYQRSVEKEIDDHVRHTCEFLYERYRRTPFAHLIYGGPSELRPRVQLALRPELRERLVGHFEIDVERAGLEEIHRRALPVIEQHEDRREQAILEQLSEGLAPNGHAASGLDETLQLLYERRVQTLLVAHGFHAAGHSCPRCGLLLAGDGVACPIDGTDLQPHADIVELAIERAVGESVDVLVLHDRCSTLESYGSIAVLLRY
jgi:peptide subunit release factor 1 (eRF1)